jgi:VWFA-related protein
MPAPGWNRMRRLLLLTALSGLLLAQTQSPPDKTTQQPPSQPGPMTRITTTLFNVVAPVLVYDSNGNYVNGLRPEQFHLYDNQKEQNIHVDVAFVPISLVILIQANAHVEKLLPVVNNIGNLIQPLIIGDQGEAAVIAYDSRIRVLQDFTSDSDKLTAAVKKISPYGGSESSHMVDAVEKGVEMLKHRPENRRRVILMIGETRDYGSEARARDTLIEMQFANIMYYAVDMSRLMATLSAPAPYPRPDNTLPTSHPMPAGIPATPTTLIQSGQAPGSSAEFMPLLIEIYKDVKGIFKANPVEVFSKGTGGSEFAYYRGHGLEDAIERIGEQLHSEYTLTYSPNNTDEGGFHEISVYVASPYAKRIQTRPGYWMATAK